MRITEVRTVLLTGPLTDDPFMRAGHRQRSAAFIEIHTDTEHTGIGETYLGYFFPEIVPPVVEFFEPILTNAESLDIYALTQRLHDCCVYWGRVGLGRAVISGIEAALWDLKGKILGLPVYELVGGKRHESLSAYATGGPSNWPLDDLFAKVDHYLEIGFTGFKVATGARSETADGPGISRTPAAIAEFEAAKVDTLRQRVGGDVRILLDGHMGFKHGPDRWDLTTAQTVLKGLEPYDLFFFEEPLPYDDADAYAELTRTTTVRVAGGESLTSLEEFRRYADAGSLDIAQPDAAWLTMTDFIDVARLFGFQNKWIASHAWGAGAAVMQNVHAAFASPNCLIVEIPPAAGPLHTEVWGESLQLVDGMLQPPEAPGLGVTLSDDIKVKFPFVPGSGEFVNVPGKVMKG